MTAKAFLKVLEKHGIQIWKDKAGNVHCQAPQGVITPAVAARIKEAKPRLLPYLPVAGPPLTPQEIAEFRQMWEETEGVRTTTD